MPALPTTSVPEVVAIIMTFNEELILEQSLDYLLGQGIGVYMMDNGSTDDTLSIIEAYRTRGIVGFEKYSDPVEPGVYNAKNAMCRKEEVALDLAKRGARWAIHYDADEIRETPWPGVSLRDGILRAGEAGYNCVDHILVNFVPTDENYRRGLSPREHFKYYLPHNQTNRHGKVWRQGNRRVDLHTRGGHFVRFRGRKIFPIPFIIKHFPILNSEHGLRKVFRERKPRYSQEGLKDGWHRHYKHIQDESHKFLYATDDPRLRLYDDAAYKKELLATHPMPEPGFFQRLFGRKTVASS